MLFDEIAVDNLYSDGCSTDCVVSENNFAEAADAENLFVVEDILADVRRVRFRAFRAFW